MKNIVILISGRGSNMEAIVRTSAAEGWPAKVAAVISNRADAAGLGFAQANGIATAVVDHTGFARARPSTRGSPKRSTPSARRRRPGRLHAHPHAGFVQRYDGRLVNIHPSLLPMFPGLHTHRRAIEAGCKVAGASVHFVTADLDHGPIIGQATVPVLPDDTSSRSRARARAGSTCSIRGPIKLDHCSRGQRAGHGVRRRRASASAAA
jgi:phosphoribosylglycinamide formyltransferase-1